MAGAAAGGAPAGTVLIVEDDESTGEAVAHSLGRAGLEAVLAPDGLAGLGAGHHLRRGD